MCLALVFVDKLDALTEDELQSERCYISVEWISVSSLSAESCRRKLDTTMYRQPGLYGSVAKSQGGCVRFRRISTVLMTDMHTICRAMAEPVLTFWQVANIIQTK